MKPGYLTQPAKLRKHDQELQEQLRAEADARGVVPTKHSRRIDFMDRSIAELEARLRKKNLPDRVMLKERLRVLKAERERHLK